MIVHETEQLLALQELDSAVDECGHRRARLPERQALADARKAVVDAEARLQRAQTTITNATNRIEELERLGHVRDAKKDRLAKQLKTVIASREAEALMHEISILDTERSVADDEELALMDAVEAGEAESEAAAAALDDGRSVAAVADDALKSAAHSIDEEVAALQAQRSGLVETLPTALVARFDSMRKQFGGVAISKLAAGRCGACHLDQSRATIEALRSGDGVTVECEQCGRLLAA
jgi:uncharacterized protein